MNILLAFLPFIVFAVLSRLVGPVEGLIGGTLTSMILLVRDRLQSRSLKILEAGTFLLFIGLTVYALTAGLALSVIEVRLWVDLGLLAIVLASMAVGRPFTMQYARENVPQEYWSSPKFVRTNFVITSVWALAFIVMVVTEAAMLHVPGTPHALGVTVIVLALVGAVKFTDRYTASAREAA
jgi:hypothetical protein